MTSSILVWIVFALFVYFVDKEICFTEEIEKRERKPLAVQSPGLLSVKEARKDGKVEHKKGG